MNKGKDADRAGWILLFAGAACIAIGSFRGEPGIVFMKAVRICMECVGIG